MSMTERVSRLREQSLDAVPTISAERARLMTEFYRQEQKLRHAAVHRALAFQYLMEHKTIHLGDGELIVGEKGPAPKANPTYPELCCHSLEDLDILNSREKISFAFKAPSPSPKAPGTRTDESSKGRSEGKPRACRRMSHNGSALGSPVRAHCSGGDGQSSVQICPTAARLRVMIPSSKEEESTVLSGNLRARDRVPSPSGR